MEVIATVARLTLFKDTTTGEVHAELDGNHEGPLDKAWIYNLIEQMREEYTSNPYVQVQASAASSAIGDL